MVPDAQTVTDLRRPLLQRLVTGIYRTVRRILDQKFRVYIVGHDFIGNDNIADMHAMVHASGDTCVQDHLRPHPIDQHLGTQSSIHLCYAAAYIDDALALVFTAIKLVACMGLLLCVGQHRPQISQF